MKKYFIFVLSAFLLLGFSMQARAESSATAFTGTRYEEQQVFVYAYNNSTSSVSANSVVILDTAGTVGSSLGAYVTTTTTADDYRVFGVTDELIGATSVGKVCVRGPHKIVLNVASTGAGVILGTDDIAGVAEAYATADGTRGGQLGFTIGGTSAGDSPQVHWLWIDPNIHR